MSGTGLRHRFLCEFGTGLEPPKPSDRALFLRGDHAQRHVSDPAPGGLLAGRRLAPWCCDRANGVVPDWYVAGVTYWVAVSDGKARAFYRHERTLRQPDGTRRSVVFWRAIGAPDKRLLKMRLASRAGVAVSAVEEWPTFADGVGSV